MRRFLMQCRAVHVSLLLDRADRLFYADRDEEALALYRRLAVLSPNLYRAHASVAYILLYLDRAEEAEASARQALRLHPTCETPYALIGVSLVMQEQHVEGLKWLRESERRGDLPPWAERSMLHALAGAEQYDECVRRCDAYLVDNPGDDNIVLVMAVMLVELGRHDEALSRLHRLHDERPDEEQRIEIELLIEHIERDARAQAAAG